MSQMMRGVRTALARARELFRRRSHFAAEQHEEFAFHLEMETAENIQRGMSEAEARRAALLAFGGTQRFLEETSDTRGIVALDSFVRDARFAFRRLRRARGFAAGIIVTLGVGIGAAVGIGTIVYGVLLRDLPYDKPNQIVRVGFITDGMATGEMQSAATYFHFAKSTRSFTELGAYSVSDAFAISDGDAPERVTVALMTPSTFTLLGAHPLLGQLFEPGDTSWSNHRSAILLSENIWRRRYGADSSIIGRHIAIDHGERIVIGVLPRSFAFPTRSVDIFYPAPVPINRPDIGVRYLTVIGRLRDGISPLNAEAELNALTLTLTKRFPSITPDILERSHARVSVISLESAMVADIRAQLVLLGVLVVAVLLIAITNVGNLFLLRAERASREIAIALSLGATRVAIAQRFVVEGITLGLASTIVALPGAGVALSTKLGFTEREIPRLYEVSFTGETVALVIGCAVLIGAAIGLIALTCARTRGLFDQLRTSRSSSSRSWRRAQDSLVAFQVALALVLLVATGLLGRSFQNLRNATIGFDPDHAMTVQLSLPWTGYTSYAATAAFHAKMIERLEALPGVTSVAVASRLPLASRGAVNLDMQLQTDDTDARTTVAAAGNMASPDYFRTMVIPMRAGRSFRSGDLHGNPAAIISERLAKSIFATTDVVGRTITQPRGASGSSRFTVIGVVGDVQWERIENGYVPTIYFPLLRDGDGLPPDSAVVPYRPRDVQYAIRGTHLPTAAKIQRIVENLDHRVPVSNVRTLGSLGSLVDEATARVRLTMMLIAVAGAGALLLGVIGVYSVVAYAANGRAREFSIRLALGAAPARVGAMVLRDGLKIVVIGTLAGLVAALGVTRFLRTVLYEVQPTSVVEFVSATILLIMVALCATLVPAHRAACTRPAAVLHGE